MPHSEEPSPASAEDTLRSMSVAEKIGQLFVAPIGRHSPNALRLPPDQRTTEVGTDAPGEVIDAIRRLRLGGICYFPTTIEGDSVEGDTPETVSALLGELTAATPAGAIPPIFAVDQEGGTVARLRRGFTGVPSAMALAATGKPAAAERATEILGTELRAVGFHQDYAPTADVNINAANPVIGIRSYGSDPDVVGEYVAAAVRGLRTAGIAATVKHFPGHGDTAVDSHLDLPVIGHDENTWAETDAPPFAAAIEAGVDAVMSGHLSLPAIDESGAPATCSDILIDDLLRTRLTFAGPVVTDALDMAGARKRYGDNEVAVRALLAGCDQLLMPADLFGAIEAVSEAVRTGRVPMTRLDEAVARILAMKERLGLLSPDRENEFDLSVVNSAVHRESALALAIRGLTALGDPGALIPSNSAAGNVAVIGCLGSVGEALADAFSVPTQQRYDSGSDPDRERVAHAAKIAGEAEFTFVITDAAWRWSGQRELLAALATAGVRHSVVATKEPYDAAYTRAADATLLTYGDGDAAVRATVAVTAGEALAGGTLPVPLPN